MNNIAPNTQANWASNKHGVSAPWISRKLLGASLAAALSFMLAREARADASLDVGDWSLDSISRTLPTTLNKAVDVGVFSFTGFTGNLDISVNGGGSGYSVAKRYVIPVRYNLVGISPANTWLKVLPAYDTGAYKSNDFDLDINVTNGTITVRLRVTATDGVHPGTANVVIESVGVQSATFTSNSAVVTPPTQQFAGSVLTQLAGRVGIATIPSSDAVLDLNGGDTNGFRIRPRSVAGSPSSGTWNIGTMIVDSTGVLYICTVTGTPGTWKKVGAP